MIPGAVTAEPAPRWARRVAHLVALTTLPAGLWRLSLALGFHAGLTGQGYADTAGSTTGKAWVIFLSVATEVFALLALGLVRPWGEVVPRWIPLVGGRAIPPMVAVVPASVGVVILLALWTPLPLWWSFPHPDMTAIGNTVVGLLYLPLIAWGPLLAMITFDYHRRHQSNLAVVA